MSRARWIIFDLNDQSYGNKQQARAAGIYLDFRRSARRYEKDKAWRVVFSSHGIVVLHKR